MSLSEPQTIALSLVSHTNVGKTTLARTLLRRDIGEVRDEAHVTLSAERHCLIESSLGDQLQLWDTPGFGDSVRLARRLAQAGNPIGWFLGEVWDRFSNRAFWSGQRAIRNIFEQADVVLYLVNAAETPDDSGHIDSEMQVLQLLKKPVVVLLNQMGQPQSPAETAAEVQRWRERLGASGCVRTVLALDAFARCWVQEGTLLRAIAPLLPPQRQDAFQRLCVAWDARGQTTWKAAMQVLAQRLARAALDREVARGPNWTDRIKDLGVSLGLRREGSETAREQAMRKLALRLEADVRTSTDQLIQLHGLGGHATESVLNRLAENYAVREPASEGKAAVLGGLVTGALAGLKADIVTGGLTLGGGMLTGGVLGALGAAGLARGYNLVRGVETPTLAWTDEVMDDITGSALLTYLAVAHFGRGRGDWSASEHPAFWLDLVDAVVAEHGEALHELWAQRDGGAEMPARLQNMTQALQALLLDVSGELLQRLYPGEQSAQISLQPEETIFTQGDTHED